MPCLGKTGEVDAKHDILWEITDFSCLSKNVGDCYESRAFFFAGEKWCLVIYPGGCSKEVSGWISLFLQKKLTKTECSIQFTLDLKKADGSLLRPHRQQISHIFQTDAHGNDKLVHKNKFLKHKSELVPYDVLSIVCTMRQDSLCSLSSPVSNMKSSGLEKLSRNFQDLMTHKKSCDVTLVVQGKSFQAHKSVLIARSSVFAAMFEHEMSESETGTVNIPDCNKESFGTFLEYLYSGRAEKISFGIALHLYRTAHKYDMQELKSFCLKLLDENLMVDGVLDAVILADEYDEDDLMTSAQDFFNSHFSEVLLTKQWECLNRQNFRLANKMNIAMSSYVLTLKRPTANQSDKLLSTDINHQSLTNPSTTPTTNVVTNTATNTGFHAPKRTSTSADFYFGSYSNRTVIANTSTTNVVTNTFPLFTFK